VEQAAHGRDRSGACAAHRRGDPDKCNVFTLHKFFSPEARQAEVRKGCTSAGIGCIECKKWLLEGVKADLDRIRARRDELLAKPEAIDEILADGACRARGGGANHGAGARSTRHRTPRWPPALTMRLWIALLALLLACSSHERAG
jgi:hypothetical protein